MARPTRQDFIEGFIDAFGVLLGRDLSFEAISDLQDDEESDGGRLAGGFSAARAIYDLNEMLDSYASERLMLLTGGRIRIDSAHLDFAISTITQIMLELEGHKEITLKEPVSEDVTRELLFLALGRTAEKLLGGRSALDT